MGGTSMQAGEMGAQAGAVGLGDVPAQVQQGTVFYNSAVEGSRNSFHELIDGLLYDITDVSNSDLVSMRHTGANGAISIYGITFAADLQKTVLRNAWRNPLSANEVMAIAYVLLQKNENTARGTTGHIYDVSFTQSIFDNIIGHSVTYSVSVTSDQSCPGANCIPGSPSTCVLEHTLHEIELWYRSRNAVMDALGFTANERQWVEHTIWGFENLL
jgi:hypothetical protein